MKQTFSTLLCSVVLLLFAQQVFAEESTDDISIIEQKDDEEEKVEKNPFAITFYKPTYLLPFYYTGSPYHAVYGRKTPDNQDIKSAETKFQLSFKVPVFQHLFNRPSDLYIAYTQQSYWQVYQHDPFFRETDYEPEIFLQNELNKKLFNRLTLNFINPGFVHQSNGKGGTLERSWNRVYVDFISSTESFMFSVRPWLILHDDGYKKHNDDLAHYMGYGKVTAAWKFREHVFSAETYNVIESAGRRPSLQLTWSFPLLPYIKGYLQVFSGYGQSLIEYDHHTTSAGIGIAFSDWL